MDQPKENDWVEDNCWVIIDINGIINEVIEVPFNDKDPTKFNKDIARAFAEDLCDFENDKYYDKEINKEWPKIDRRARIKYLQEQITILRYKRNIKWNAHGNGVEEGLG
jgi:hypothetical protein